MLSMMHNALAFSQRLALMLILLITTSVSWAENASPILLDRIIAVVNDDIILKSELDARVEEAKMELKARNISIADPSALTRKVLDNIVMEHLQLQRIKELGLKISDEAILGKIQEIAEQNKLTLVQLRDRLNQSQPNGFSKFRDRIRQKMLFQKLRDTEVLAKTQVTEDEIDHYLQRQNLVQNNTEYHLGHIMVNLPESATPVQRETARKKAADILQKLTTGEDFSQLAVRYSDGSKALEGGDLGWLNSDQIPNFFISTLQTLNVGENSQLIRSPVGFHIIKLKGKRNKDSKVVHQYHVYRFVLLSDKAQQASAPPPALISLAKSIHTLAEFKTLNKRYSDIPASVNANGDLGWLTLSEMPVEYRPIIENLPESTTASPLATPQGWEILYLDGVRNIDLSIANKRADAMKNLRMKKANQTYEIWLRRLKDEALISLRLDDSKILVPLPSETDN